MRGKLFFFKDFIEVSFIFSVCCQSLLLKDVCLVHLLFGLHCGLSCRCETSRCSATGLRYNDTGTLGFGRKLTIPIYNKTNKRTWVTSQFKLLSDHCRNKRLLLLNCFQVEIMSNGVLELTLDGGSEKFKGFLVMAFDNSTDSISKPLGTFTASSSSQTIDCSSGTKVRPIFSSFVLAFSTICVLFNRTLWRTLATDWKEASLLLGRHLRTMKDSSFSSLLLTHSFNRFLSQLHHSKCIFISFPVNTGRLM